MSFTIQFELDATHSNELEAVVQPLIHREANPRRFNLPVVDIPTFAPFERSPLNIAPERGTRVK
ncbi:MAG: hypothetical protein LBU32_02795 [Clostridiales bacterium]|nr:hypothetical protein [Clostridiales bacterium]